MGLLSVLSFLAVWQAASDLLYRGGGPFSSPIAVVRAGVGLFQSAELVRHLAITAAEMLAGMLPAIVVGAALGVLLGRVRLLRNLLDPLLTAMYVSPRVALLPLLVIWVGIGAESKVLLAFLSAVFPILVMTQTGMSTVDRQVQLAARSFGASRGQLLAKVLVPSVLPSLLLGIRLGTGRAIMGVLAGEMYVASAGAGFLLQDFANAGRTAEVLALGICIAAVGYACVSCVAAVERRTGRWRAIIAD